MIARVFALLVCVAVVVGGELHAQTTDNLEPIEPTQPLANPPRRPIAQVTQTAPKLPNDRGQVWREYDITPYTKRVNTTNRPEQALVDWILRETGYEAWHSDPLGILSATPDVLRVYHTPEMHAVVSEMVDRFVGNQAQSVGFSVQVVAVGNPNWRARAQPMLRPVRVQSPAMQAWLMQREEAAMLVTELRKRMDVYDLGQPYLMVQNGQPAVVALTQPRQYARDVRVQVNVWPPVQLEMVTLNEGFHLEVSPLLGPGGRTVDAVVRCHIDQIEKMLPVTVETPTPADPRQTSKIEVPQVSQCRVHERFRWPVDQVMVVSLGVVPVPARPESGNWLSNLPLVSGGAPRADVLLVIEARATAPGPAPGAAGAGPFATSPWGMPGVNPATASLPQNQPQPQNPPQSWGPQQPQGQSLPGPVERR